METVLRTNIDIDDTLMADAMKATGKTTKKGTVEEALRRIVQLERQKRALEELRGIGWEGDLDEIRRNFFRDFSQELSELPD